MPNGTKNTNYLIALVALVMMAVGSIVVITVTRPEKDNTVVITVILGFVAQITVAILAMMKGQETHAVVNSRMDEFKDLLKQRAVVAVDVARLEGKEAGREAERAIAPAIAPSPVQVVAEQIVSHQTVKAQSTKPPEGGA